MKKFIVKTFLIFLPFLAAIGIELFVLPIDFFTFRVWESLRVEKFLKGKFYPNKEITRIEEGDLAPHTRFAYKRKVTWITDRYGYRKQNTNLVRQEIVIIGDSHTVGSGLTQEDILSEVLEKKLRVGVYPYAPASLKTFLKDRRFRLNLPDVIIIARIEISICDDLPPVKVSTDKASTQLEKQLFEIEDRFENLIFDNRFAQFFGECLDRIYKENMLYSLRARLRRIGSSYSRAMYPPNSIATKDGIVLFAEGARANREVSKGHLDRAISIIKSYNELLKTKGIRFIFLPIPNKENIYYKYLQTEKPIFLEQLIPTLRKLGIETIDTQKAFDEAFERGVSLYQRDDSHWSAQGVKLTADLIEQTLKKDGWEAHRK